MDFLDVRSGHRNVSVLGLQFSVDHRRPSFCCAECGIIYANVVTLEIEYDDHLFTPYLYRVYQNDWSGLEVDYIHKYGEQNYK